MAAPEGVQFLADPLCEQLANIQPERPPASTQALGKSLVSVRRQIDRHGLDGRIPKPERYHLEAAAEAFRSFPSPEEDPLYTLSRSQIEFPERSSPGCRKGATCAPSRNQPEGERTGGVPIGINGMDS